MSRAARSPQPTVDGLLLLDKPAGISSHDAVLRARRAVGERRAGHGGTLDPFATGLLVVLLGRATRLLPWMPGEPKVYEARIAFGRETDTDDLLGAVVRDAPPPSMAAIADALPRLTGTLAQVPPAYSAKRIEGRRAYALARTGAVVDLAPSTVQVHRWELLAHADDTLDVRITCGGGTYIRALARDLGRLTGSAAHLSSLRRVASGPFEVARATPVEQLTPGMSVAPAVDALLHLPRIPLEDEEVRKVIRGLEVGSTTDADGTRAALVDARGALVAAAEARGGRWWPRVVMWLDQ